MTKRISLALLAALAMAILPGCTTTSTTKPNWTDPAFVDKVAFFLKATIANGVTIAVAEDQNAVSYCTIAREALIKVRKGTNFTPGAFENALTSIPVNELKGKYAKLAINGASLAYEFYFSQLVANGIQGDTIAPMLIDATIDGIALGLQNQAPAVPPKPQLQTLAVSK